MARQSELLIKPSLEEVQRQAAKIGLPATEAEQFFFYYQSNGWRVGKNPMKCWLSAMAGWKLRWSARTVERGARVTGADKIIWEKEYERVLDRMRAVRSSYSEHQSWSQSDRELWAKLKERKKELAVKLGIVV
jgi:hypothetical protein